MKNYWLFTGAGLMSTMAFVGASQILLFALLFKTNYIMRWDDQRIELRTPLPVRLQIAPILLMFLYFVVSAAATHDQIFYFAAIIFVCILGLAAWLSKPDRILFDLNDKTYSRMDGWKRNLFGQNQYRDLREILGISMTTTSPYACKLVWSNDVSMVVGASFNRDAATLYADKLRQTLNLRLIDD